MKIQGINTKVGDTIKQAGDIITLTSVIDETEKMINYRTKGTNKRIGKFTSIACVNKNKFYEKH